jgi:hypothetical protein
MTNAEFERGAATASRLRREAAERREQNLREPEPVHVRRRFPKGAGTKRWTARCSIAAYSFLSECCRKSGRESAVVLDEIIRQVAGLPNL